MSIWKNITDQIKFLSEPLDSPDFGKSREDWQAAKDSADAEQDAPWWRR